MSFRVALTTFFVLLFALMSPSPAHAAAPPRKVLYFTKSSGWEHTVVKRTGGALSFSERLLAQLGPPHGIEFTFSKDGSLFSAAYLAQFDAIIFFTSGDLFARGTDGTPPMAPAGKAALLAAVESGKGFVALHSASDSFHTGETIDTVQKPTPASRYQLDGPAADPYIRMLGGEFIRHGTEQPATISIVDPNFPGLSGRNRPFQLHEEWYSLTEFAPDLHVLLVPDTDKMRDPNAARGAAVGGGYLDYVRPPYPLAWARLHGKGRVFYTALGHREDIWTNPLFQDMLFGALDWALHRVDADVTPNIRQVTPRAWELPPQHAPAPPATP